MPQLWELKDRNVMRDVSYPSVFIYDLPPGFNARFLPGSPVRRPPSVRPEMDLLHERLLSSKHRVATGDSADFFFIPLNLAGVRAPMGAYLQARKPDPSPDWCISAGAGCCRCRGRVG